MEARKAGVLIGLENREGLRAVRVRPSPSPPDNGEHSLMGKPHAVIVVDIGSSPFVHPTLAGVCYPRINGREATLIRIHADIVQLLERGVASARIWIGVPLSAPNNCKGLASREVP